MGRFQGKTVIITGASAGIGEATARRFAAEGARLALAARGAQALERLAGELSSSGAEVIAVPTDVTDDDACAALVDRAQSNLGGIHVLINNAGAHVRGGFEDNDPDALVNMVDVNLRAPVLLTRLALPYLRRSGGGAVVNVASLAGRVPLADASVYSATKFGLRAFSLAMADELAGSGITVSAVSPGPVDTGFIMDDIDGVSDIVFAQPMSSADDIAQLIVECATDGKPERMTPRSSGYLATIAYLAPGLRRALRPLMQARGRRVKDRYRNRGR